MIIKSTTHHEDNFVFEFDYCESGSSIVIKTKVGNIILSLSGIPPIKFKRICDAFNVEISRGAKKHPFDKRQPTLSESLTTPEETLANIRCPKRDER